MRLGHPGWRERYYKEKFFAENADQIEKIRKEIVCLNAPTDRYLYLGLMFLFLYLFVVIIFDSA